jgi:hypothetical protein
MGLPTSPAQPPAASPPAEHDQQHENLAHAAHDLWWMSPAALPAGLTPLLVLHGTSLSFGHVVGALALQFLTLSVYLTGVPLMKELAHRWTMDIRYGRKEAVRRRRKQL